MKSRMALLFCTCLWACESDEHTVSTFEKTISYGRRDIASHVISVDGGFVVTGQTESFRGNQDVYVIGIDGNANQRWARTFGSDGPDYGFASAGLPDGTIVVAGRRWMSRRGYDFYFFGLNGTGQQLWSRSFGEGGDDEIRSVARANDGDIVMAGTVSLGRVDPVVMKLSTTGDVRWIRTIGDSNIADFGMTIQTVGAGGYVMSGHSVLPTVQERTFLARLDDSGGMTWKFNYGEMRNRNNCLVATSDGEYLAAGRAYLGLGKWSAWAVRVLGDGSEAWEQIFHFSGSGYDEIYSVVESDHGTIVATGTAYDDSLAFQAFIMEVDGTGSVLWSHKYGGPGHEAGHAILRMTSGYLVVGSTTKTLQASEDVYVLKTDKQGLIEVD